MQQKQTFALNKQDKDCIYFSYMCVNNINMQKQI